MSNLKRSIQPMPDFVRRALESRSLMAAYESRPPYQRNDYLWWINKAKQQDTKEKRLAKMLSELEARSGYMGMKWSPE
jgi:uncharacterized protein YdeI (YjbR/CyaY-like superfamily)